MNITIIALVEILGFFWVYHSAMELGRKIDAKRLTEFVHKTKSSFYKLILTNYIVPNSKIVGIFTVFTYIFTAVAYISTVGWLILPASILIIFLLINFTIAGPSSLANNILLISLHMLVLITIALGIQYRPFWILF
ncbi:MAG: hypothetical protein JRN20_02960 [Nitrososphaerota archaeon]|nr:hypothetical protein [Nitrososphaerota archaeon]